MGEEQARAGDYPAPAPVASTFLRPAENSDKAQREKPTSSTWAMGDGRWRGDGRGVGPPIRDTRRTAERTCIPGCTAAAFATYND